MSTSPSITHFSDATDRGIMRSRLQAALQRMKRPPAVIENLRIPRVFPRVGGGFTIQYEAQLKDANGSRRVVLCGHLLGPTEAWPAYAREHAERVLVLRDLRLVVPVFPFDPKLRHLEEIYDLESAREILSARGLLGHRNGDPMVLKREVLGYRLEKRCVLRFRLAGPAGRSDSEIDAQVARVHAEPADPGRESHSTLVVKVVPPRKARKISESTEMLIANGFTADSADHITVAEPCGADREIGLVFMKSAPGHSLHDLVSTEAYTDGCDAAARTLRKLHSLTPPPAGMPSHGVSNELAQLESWASVAGTVHPRWRIMFDDAFAAVHDASNGKQIGRHDAVCIHRDFYDKQVLYAPERTTLLDTDNLAAGDPAQDYGNFIAHLFLRVEQETADSMSIYRGMEQFEKSYGITDSQFVARAQWWKAATLLRLAILYSLRPRWRHLTSKLLRTTKAYSQSPE